LREHKNILYDDNIKMNKYNEILSIKYPSEKSDTCEYEKYINRDIMQKGGKNSSSVPNGGFPPIYICDSTKEQKEKSTSREYNTHKTAISIHDIMKKRRNKTA
jgi:hypothetical protein